MPREKWVPFQSALLCSLHTNERKKEKRHELVKYNAFTNRVRLVIIRDQKMILITLFCSFEIYSEDYYRFIGV